MIRSNHHLSPSLCIIKEVPVYTRCYLQTYSIYFHACSIYMTVNEIHKRLL
jgi:hypothetical protein